VTRRSGARASSAGRAKTPAKKRAGAGAGNGNGSRQVGSREFTRRARSVAGGQAVQRRPAGRGLAGFAARLPSLSYRDLPRRVPRAAWICALVACLNAICWSIVTPPFQAPDEPDHFAYVKQLAETGSLPSSDLEEQSSVEEIATLDAIGYYHVRQQPQNHTIASHAEQTTLEGGLANIPHDTGSTGAGVATTQPPLYYALEAIPYTLAESGNVLDRLQLMRLMSTLFAGLTALFVFMFVREALPGAPWAWTVGGLSVALVPLLGFTSGIVNPDSMLLAVSAATFYVLARAFRRGLDTAGAVAIGAVVAVGLATKLNYVGLVPGVVLALVILSVRGARLSGRSALRRLALALGIGFSPAVLYAAVNALSNHAALGILSRTANTTHGSSLLAQLDYIWQLYLPRLPGTTNYFPGLFTARQFWFDGYVGLYGWFDTTFPGWVYSVALIPAGALALLCARSLVQSRAPLRSRWSELAVYAVMGVGLLALVGADSFRIFPRTDAEFAQTRYMLPLLALLGGALALAARAAGRRWGPVVGALIVVLFLAHDVFSQMLVAGRFYG
jgi:hypothetical protein